MLRRGDVLVSDEKKPPPARVWRISTEAPRGAFVDSLPAPVGAAGTPAPTANPPMVLTPARVPSWRSSSYDLAVGLKVRDITDTIPGDLFDQLFKR